jgi:uncharacterized membrane protein YcgQ (UPF0703/DUF1980 family)
VFRAEGANTVTVNGTSIIGSGGIYTTSIELSEVETPITIQTKNKYFSDENSFLITRNKTPEEINAEKEAEARAIAEQKESERKEKEAQRQAEEQKRQELENEKKTYTSIAYNKLSKNPEKYKGERIKFRGKIFHAEEEDINSMFQINTDGYGYDDQILTLATWSNEYAE